MKDSQNSLRLIVGENIRHCREKCFPGRGGMSTCAEEFGVSIQQWSPWELGKRLPSDDRLAKIADFLGTSIEWLRTRHDFDNTGPDHAQRIDINLGSGDAALFFRKLERALANPNRGDILVSITVKPGKKAGKRRRDSV